MTLSDKQINERRRAALAKQAAYRKRVPVNKPGAIGAVLKAYKKYKSKR